MLKSILSIQNNAHKPNPKSLVKCHIRYLNHATQIQNLVFWQWVVGRLLALLGPLGFLAVS